MNGIQTSFLEAEGYQNDYNVMACEKHLQSVNVSQSNKSMKSWRIYGGKHKGHLAVKNYVKGIY